VPKAFDLSRILRRLKPDKRTGQLQRRPEGSLPLADDEKLAGPALLLDTSVYIHVLRGKTPVAVDKLLVNRTLYHSATAIAELSIRLGVRTPVNAKEAAARKELIEAIKDIPTHRVIAPTTADWVEAGILSGLRSRLGGFGQHQGQDAMNDALLLLQAREAGATVLTSNFSDFDLLQQLVPNARVIFYKE
jgi:predicted nucleic acid-binding protein